jgi:hypothetical protein
LKKEALDRTMWRARFGRGFGPVVRQTTKWNECCYSIYKYVFLGVLLKYSSHSLGRITVLLYPNRRCFFNFKNCCPLTGRRWNVVK